MAPVYMNINENFHRNLLNLKTFFPSVKNSNSNIWVKGSRLGKSWTNVTFSLKAGAATATY